MTESSLAAPPAEQAKDSAPSVPQLEAKLEAAKAELPHLREAAELLRRYVRGQCSPDRFGREWLTRDKARPSTAARSGSVGDEAGACHKCGGAAQVNDGDDGIGPPVCVNCYDAEWVPPQPPAPDSPEPTEYRIHARPKLALTLADVDRRIAELARAAGDLAGIDHFASRRALERLQEAAEAGKP